MLLIWSSLFLSVLELNSHISKDFDVFRIYLCRNLILFRPILIYRTYISYQQLWYTVSISLFSFYILYPLINPILVICWPIRPLLALPLDVLLLDVYMDVCCINKLWSLYWNCWLTLSFLIPSIFSRNQLFFCWDRCLLMGYLSPFLGNILMLFCIFLWQYINILIIW